MRVVSFSNASTQPFPVASIQIFTPWIARLKNVLRRVKTSVAPGHHTHLARQSTASKKETPAPAIDALACRGAIAPKPAPRGGLRIVREFDSAVGAECAGRMVISGRMADVCAELDRMALRGTDAP